MLRSENEVAVNHLIVDASAFIKNAPLLNIGATIYTVHEVIKEIRDKQTRERMKMLPYELKLKDPSAESVDIVKDISKRTGDYAALSTTDLKLLALVHDLHVQYIGKESINYAVKSIVEVSNDIQEVKKEENKVPFGFVIPDTNHQNDEGYLDDDVGWIDETNIASVLGEHGVTNKINEKLAVAVISSDFAIQNVVMHMKMNLVSMDGMIIKTLKSYLMRCRSCYSTTADITKKFCPKCGNDSLHRVAATVDEDGTVRLHIDWEKVNSTRGLGKMKKTIKGGKHDDCDQFFEDQRLPHNRPARVIDNFFDESPFAMHDVSSRSAILGIRANRSGARRR